MDLQKIGTFLKELRKEKELTQEQLAETLNVSRRTVSRWETGSNMPDLDLLVEMADFFDTSVDALIGYQMKDNRLDAALERLTALCQSKDQATDFFIGWSDRAYGCARVGEGARLCSLL